MESKYPPESLSEDFALDLFSVGKHSTPRLDITKGRIKKVSVCNLITFPLLFHTPQEFTKQRPSEQNSSVRIIVNLS